MNDENMRNQGTALRDGLTRTKRDLLAAEYSDNDRYECPCLIGRGIKSRAIAA